LHPCPTRDSSTDIGSVDDDTIVKSKTVSQNRFSIASKNPKGKFDEKTVEEQIKRIVCDICGLSSEYFKAIKDARSV